MERHLADNTEDRVVNFIKESRFNSPPLLWGGGMKSLRTRQQEQTELK